MFHHLYTAIKKQYVHHMFGAWIIGDTLNTKPENLKMEDKMLLLYIKASSNHPRTHWKKYGSRRIWNPSLKLLVLPKRKCKLAQHLFITVAIFLPISSFVCSETGTSPRYMSKKAPAQTPLRKNSESACSLVRDGYTWARKEVLRSFSSVKARKQCKSKYI